MAASFRFDQAKFHNSAANAKWIATLEDVSAPDLQDRVQAVLLACLAGVMCTGVIVAGIGMWNYGSAGPSRQPATQGLMSQADSGAATPVAGAP